MNLKKFKVAGILFLVILALGGLATWDEWKSNQEDTAKKTGKKLASFKNEDVVEIRYVSRPDPAAATPETSVDVTVAKLDGTWRLVKPVEMLADTQAIDNLLRSLSDYQYEKVIATGSDKLEQYGLKEPAREVILKFKDDMKPLTIAVGSKAPTGYSVYSKVSNSDDVYIGGQQLFMATSKTMHEFRDKTLIKIDSKAVTAMTYTNKADHVKLEFERKGKESAFHLVEAKADVEADSAEVRDFLDEISRTRVDRFVDVLSPEEKATLADPAYTVTWKDQSGATTSLLFALHKGKLLAAFPAADITHAYEVGDALRDKIQKTETDFRNRRILRIASDDLNHVEVDGDQFQKIGGDWYLAADAAKFENGAFKGDVKDKPEAQGYIRAFLVDLEFAKTDEFLAPDDAALKKLPAAPVHRLKVAKAADGSDAITLDLYTDELLKDKYYVKVSGASAVYRVLRSTFNHMTPGEKTPEGRSSLVPEGEQDDVPLDQAAGVEEDADRGH